MEQITMGTTIGIITAIFLALLSVILMQAIKLTSRDASIDNKEKQIDSLLAEIEVIKKEHNIAISNIKDSHVAETESLNNEITKLKNILSQNKPPTVKPPPIRPMGRT